MAYDEELARRISSNLEPFRNDVEEKKMFGGVGYMYKGKMCCGVVKDELMIRVISEKYEEALAHPHTRVMDFTDKPMKNFLYVAPEGFRSEEDLTHWINLGIEHAEEQQSQ